MENKKWKILDWMKKYTKYFSFEGEELEDIMNMVVEDNFSRLTEMSEARGQVSLLTKLYEAGLLLEKPCLPEKMLEVESSNICKIGVDINNNSGEECTVFIEFSGGSIYRYKKVPRDTWRGFYASESKGKFFHKEIKSEGYEFDKIEGVKYKLITELI